MLMMNFKYNMKIHAFELIASIDLFCQPIFGYEIVLQNHESILITRLELQGQNRHLKLGHRSAICWKYIGLYRDYGLDHIVYRYKTFFFQDRKLTFSAPVWKRISWNLSKFQHIQLIQAILFPFVLSFVWLSCNFVKFHEIIFQTNDENFSLLNTYLEKQKSLIRI